MSEVVETSKHNTSSEQTQQVAPLTASTSAPASSSSSNSSPSNSISLIKLDELSSFGATKQGRLPTLIKLNTQEEVRNPNSMPAIDVQKLESQSATTPDRQQSSLPSQVKLASEKEGQAEKENQNNQLESGDFQMVEMLPNDLMGPSLPPQVATEKVGHQGGGGLESVTEDQQQHQRNVLASLQQSGQFPTSQLGDSLIDMIINLKNENQNLVRALETNNEYVKERIEEFKRNNEEAKKREAKFAIDKAEHEHQLRKLQRQNKILSERLKSMEAKLKDMKLEVGDTLVAAHSSKTSSIRDEQAMENLYPNLADNESFGNSALNQATTMQVDATSGELYNDNDLPPTAPQAPPMDTEPKSVNFEASTSNNNAHRFNNMTKEELSKHFDANKAEFYAMDDPMKQCDKLEKQLNDIGKRDYEICLLQQQLNIYRQDFRLERMANLEAKIQIEKLKNDIDRICYERLREKTGDLRHSSSDDDTRGRGKHHLHRGFHRSSGSGGAGVRFEPVAAAAGDVISKLGHQLGKKAAKSAAKAAKYAAKQAHREEKAAAAAANMAAAASSSSNQATNAEQPEVDYHGHRRHHSHHHNSRRGIRSEVVSDLLSTANKAMLTGYKMASTQMNLALDKLSQYEQQQASQLAVNRRTSSADNKPSAPPMGTPSLD